MFSVVAFGGDVVLATCSTPFWEFTACGLSEIENK